MFLYFEIFILFFFGIFKLLENMCHATRTVGQTLKEKENYFWCFFTKRGHTVRATGQTQWSERERFYFFWFFIYFFCKFFI